MQELISDLSNFYYRICGTLNRKLQKLIGKFLNYDESRSYIFSYQFASNFSQIKTFDREKVKNSSHVLLSLKNMIE